MEDAEEIFSKGKWIVHVYYGVGQIKGTEKKILEGEKRTFFKVKTFDGVYWLPVTNIGIERVRPLASKNKFGRAFTILRKPPKVLPNDFRERKKKISQVLNDVSLYAKARLLRDLNGRSIHKKMGLSEQDAFDKIKKHILNELSVVKCEDREILEMKLAEALETSLEKSSNQERKTWLEKVKKEVRRKRKAKNTS